ncbi:PD40 domain-containing protein [Micromonospora eburnea]|uniref:WD40-like Beta Propeller Repeat n=1 Tax=Micromonospora eburnea TaxID=227316 RepID=A0A1C6VQM4_9ACTN|nr:PD40 domain-containing protein [Micromonospora eburnea]SCL68492.1 WD40-like Beta Propeller Repeat [Micromonospora eburnea]
MNQDRLRLDLADLADEVTPVDLRDRALRTSRRLGIQRAIATSAAAVVMLGAATGTAFALMPRNDGQAPLPGDSPSITVTPSPAEVTPTPDPSASASVGATSTKPAFALTGTRYYLETTSTQALIHAVRSGSDEVVRRVRFSTDGCAGNTITVSPDGKRVAWVQDSTDGGNTGVLMAGTVGKQEATRLLDGVDCLGSNPLVWRGSDLLMVSRGGVSVLFDVAARKRVNGDPGQETLRCWSADGRWLAAVSDGKPYVTDETQLHQYTYTPPKGEAVKWDGWRVRSVSMDGRYVSVGWIGTDPSRQDGSFAVVDTTTSKTVTLPVSGDVRSIQFAADGKVLVRQASKVVVLDAGFQKIGEVAEPRAVQHLTLLTYAP